MEAPTCCRVIVFLVHVVWFGDRFFYLVDYFMTRSTLIQLQWYVSSILNVFSLCVLIVSIMLLACHFTLVYHSNVADWINKELAKKELNELFVQGIFLSSFPQRVAHFEGQKGGEEEHTTMASSLRRLLSLRQPFFFLPLKFPIWLFILKTHNF